MSNQKRNKETNNKETIEKSNKETIKDKKSRSVSKGKANAKKAHGKSEKTAKEKPEKKVHGKSEKKLQKESENKIQNILSELCGEKVTDNSLDIQQDLALDSLAMVTLLIELEDAFSIQFEETDMNPFDLTTVQSVIDLVGKYTGDENE